MFALKMYNSRSSKDDTDSVSRAGVYESIASGLKPPVYDPIGDQLKKPTQFDQKLPLALPQVRILEKVERLNSAGTIASTKMVDFDLPGIGKKGNVAPGMPIQLGERKKLLSVGSFNVCFDIPNVNHEEEENEQMQNGAPRELSELLVNDIKDANVVVNIDDTGDISSNNELEQYGMPEISLNKAEIIKDAKETKEAIRTLKEIKINVDKKEKLVSENQRKKEVKKK